MHVIGGQQLTWPPYSHVVPQNKKEKSNELGFSLVIEKLIELKKILLGQNPMYDWLYMYN